MASSIINSDDGSVSGTTGLKTTGGDDGALEIQSVGTKYMTVAAGGDISFYEDTGTTAKFFWDASAESLGIGTSSPSGLIHSYQGASGQATVNVNANGLIIEDNGNNGISILTPSSATGAIFFGDQDDNFIGGIEYEHPANALSFTANNSERMRIDSSGNVGIGTSSPSNPLHVYEGAGDVVRIQTGRTTAANVGMILFYDGSGDFCGQITSNPGTNTTAYNTSSDYRLKDNVQPMVGATDRLKQLKPCTWDWKSAPEIQGEGFIAHEAQEVVPEAVTGTKDAVEAIGNITDAEGTVVQENVTEPEELSEGQTWTKTEDRPVYQGIDQAKLVPLLTAALQEAVSKIEALETRIAALEA